MKPTIIYCTCGEPCGKKYPATGPTHDSGGEQAYREGSGENFVDEDGTWFCSEACRDEAKCGRPCAPERSCNECIPYWERMRNEGYWKDGSGWTKKGMREILKYVHFSHED